MTTRRHFLAATAAAPLLAQIKPRSANDNIQIAIIGAGGMGSEDVRSSIKAGSKLVAASDIYQGRLIAHAGNRTARISSSPAITAKFWRGRTWTP